MKGLKDLVAEDRTKKERLILCLCVAIFTAFTLLVFAPFELIMVNPLDIWFGVEKVWFVFIGLACAAVAATTGIGLLLKGKLLDVYLSMLFGGTLALYIQGNFIHIDHLQLDGTMLPWEEFGSLALTNLALFLFIAGLPLILRYLSKAFWKRTVCFLSLALTVVQTVTLATVFMTADKTHDDHGFVYDEVFSFSREENTLWIILDWFDNDLLAPALEEWPEALDTWEGFTFYPDTVGISMYTYPSVAEEMTGEMYYRFRETYADYLRQAWDGDTFVKAFCDAGYDVRMLADTNVFVPEMDAYIKNYIKVESRFSSYTDMLRCMAKLVCYRYMPLALKPGFWMQMTEMNQCRVAPDTYELNDDVALYERFMEQQPVDASCPSKAFRFYHFNGVHDGDFFNRDLKNVANDQFWPHDQVLGSIKMVNALLAQMKAAGVYDNTTIVISADHGNTDWDAPAGVTPYSDVPYSTLPNNPVLFVKPKDASGPWQSVDAQAWVMDIVPTLMDDADIVLPFDTGHSLIGAEEGLARERYFLFNNSPVYGEQVKATEKYVVRGNANDLANWKKAD